MKSKRKVSELPAGTVAGGSERQFILRRGVRRRRWRKWFVAGVGAISAIYILLAIVTWIRPPTQAGDAYAAVAWLSYAVACFILAVRASRVLRVSAVSWSRVTQHMRQVAGTGAFLLVCAFVLYWNHDAWTQALRAPVNALISFFAVGALVVVFGAARSRQWEIEKRYFVPLFGGTYVRGSRTVNIPNPSGQLTAIAILVVADVAGIWLFSADPTVDMVVANVHVPPNPEAAFGAASLIAFAIPVALRTFALRRASVDEFMKAGEYALQFVTTNAVFVVAVAAMLFWPTHASAFAPFLGAVTAAIVGTQLVGFAGSSRTDFVAVCAEMRVRAKEV
jgi:hypothetical protein